MYRSPAAEILTELAQFKPVKYAESRVFYSSGELRWCIVHPQFPELIQAPDRVRDDERQDS
jgi:hypothetical protein